MKVTGYTAVSVKSFTSPYSTDSKKSIVGSAILDMSYVIDKDGTAQKLLLCLKEHSDRKGKT